MPVSWAVYASTRHEQKNFKKRWIESTLIKIKRIVYKNCKILYETKNYLKMMKVASILIKYCKTNLKIFNEQEKLSTFLSNFDKITMNLLKKNTIEFKLRKKCGNFYKKMSKNPQELKLLKIL